MALIKCKECGNNISTEAVSCPQCGAPVVAQKTEKKPKEISKGKGCLAILLIGAVIVLAITVAVNETKPPVSSPSVSTAKKQVKTSSPEDGKKYWPEEPSKVVEGSKEPDWNQRYEYWINAFKRPVIGEVVKVQVSTVVAQRGKLISLTTNDISLSNGQAVITLYRKDLPLDVRMQFFADDFARNNVNREKVKFEVQKNLEVNITRKAEPKESLEYMLATLDAKKPMLEDDVLVVRFRSLLKQLSATYIESQQEIGDMTLNAQRILREKDGITETMRNMMEGMNQIIFDKKIENQKYAEYIAAYVVLRGKGVSHQEAVEGIRDILDVFLRAK